MDTTDLEGRYRIERGGDENGPPRPTKGFYDKPEKPSVTEKDLKRAKELGPVYALGADVHKYAAEHAEQRASEIISEDLKKLTDEELKLKRQELQLAKKLLPESTIIPQQLNFVSQEITRRARLK